MSHDRRARNSTRARRICFEAHKKKSHGGGYTLACHVCRGVIDPVRDYWEADHIRRWSEGGEDTADNLHPICKSCAGIKNPSDTRDIAHGKRASEKRLGIRKSKRPMAGSRNSQWKRTLDGRVIRRTGR